MNIIRSLWGELMYWFVLTYTSPRYVVIKSPTLGIMNLCFQGLILIYILLYVLLWDKGYLKIYPPAGITRMTVREPDYRAMATDLLRNSTFGTYCTNYGALPTEGWAHPCHFLRHTQLTAPPSRGPQLSIATRVRREVLALPDGCPAVDERCPLSSVESRTYFSFGVERSTVFIDHSVMNPNARIERNLADMHGSLLNCDGKTMKSFSARRPGQDNLEYILERVVTIEQLFEATTGASDHCESVSIDSVSDANPAKNQSIRYHRAWTRLQECDEEAEKSSTHPYLPCFMRCPPRPIQGTFVALFQATHDHGQQTCWDDNFVSCNPAQGCL